MKKLKPTGKTAVDGEREIFIDEETGQMFDLQPDWKGKEFTIIGPAEADPRRVLIKSDGVAWDVSPETARELTDC